jgi:hypothetical protein
MPDLNAEKERIDKKHRAAKAILKWLAGLPSRQDAIDVLNHVGIDLKVVVTEVKAPDGK